MTSSHGHHAFHLVDMSPWPLTGSISAMMLTTGLVKWFHQFNPDLLILGVTATTLTMIQWWRDITREGTYQGLHTNSLSKKRTITLSFGLIFGVNSPLLAWLKPK